jgi:L-ascorbate metabolism protein UlaG (beta-lactamase superfamily)
MNVTKYPQSCLVLEKEGKRILIDPGSFMAAKYSASDLPEFEAIMLTHRHPDHANADFIIGLQVQKRVPVYANQDTKELLGDQVTAIIEPGDTVEIAGFSVKAYDMPHCALPDGSAGPPNNGYVFDENFLHAGDGISVEGVRVENAAIAIAGPDISLRDAADLIKSVGATKVIPIHYSIFGDEKPMAAAGLVRMGAPDVEMIVLENGETTSL